MTDTDPRDLIAEWEALGGTQHYGHMRRSGNALAAALSSALDEVAVTLEQHASLCGDIEALTDERDTLQSEVAARDAVISGAKVEPENFRDEPGYYRALISAQGVLSTGIRAAGIAGNSAPLIAEARRSKSGHTYRHDLLEIELADALELQASEVGRLNAVIARVKAYVGDIDAYNDGTYDWPRPQALYDILSAT